MAKPINSRDAQANQAIVSTLIDQAPRDVSAVVGINALGRLAEILPHEEFVKFMDGALHHATTGEIPPDQDEQQEQQEPQQAQEPTASPAPAAAQ